MTKVRPWIAVLFLGAAFVASLMLGPARVSVAALIQGTLHPNSPEGGLARTLLLDLRLPRTVLACVTGAGLALSGALLQAYFQNPMAGPYVIGVSSGAGLAVSIALLFAGTAGPPAMVVPAAALLGGILVVLAVSVLAERVRGRRTEVLLLLGLAIAAICSAVTSVLLLMLPRGPEGVLFWLMGSLAGAGWGSVAMVGAALVIGGGIGLILNRDLDAILWGDEIARSVGVDVAGRRRMILLAATIPVAASVAACGVIGFLGLMVPHIARGVVGPAHRKLLPLSACLGAGLLLTADILARMLLTPAELPVGAITSAVGAPFLIAICLRRR